ncbi:MAG: diaminopimelate epimerase [Acidobacteria bacterium]|nr:diaminopimelate epimerase [Acidobacteriota bacterium]
MTGRPSIALVKAHAYGNDFLLVHAADVSAEQDLPALARQACDRHRGIGADGLMLVEDTTEGASTQLFNADGSRAEVSGNGVRCAAAWLASRRGLQAGDRIVIETAAGPKRLDLLEASTRRFTFRADMGAPTDLRRLRLRVHDEEVDVIALRVGNPQCVVLGPATEERLHGLAAGLSVHPAFPEGSNVELADVRGPGHVRILIWERGVGPTEASGTGACAAAVASAFAGGAARDVTVESPGGAQHVEWTDETIWLTGWAEIVADIAWWR